MYLNKIFKIRSFILSINSEILSHLIVLKSDNKNEEDKNSLKINLITL